MAKEKPWAGKFRPDRDLDDNGNTNEVRAGRGRRALDAYAEGIYSGPPYDDPCIIQDLICDLLHLKDSMIANGVWIDEDVGDVVDKAVSCHEEER
jgi:hypothetical protein